jgi:cyclophilin family peptidyl-prolyl cis-trans isomerase
MKFKLLLLSVLVLSLFSCEGKLDKKYKTLPEGIYADIQLDEGDILLSLEFEKTPITVANFVSLAEGTSTRVIGSLKGKPFYDGLIFHRVLSKINGSTNDFMVQGGDPLANGLGGPGYTFIDEFSRDSIGKLMLKHDGPGVLSMANSGPGTNGSQFFITMTPQQHLNGRHTVFGEVVNGQKIVDNMKVGAKMNTVKIVRIGEKAKEFNAVKTFNNQFKKTGKLKSSFLKKVDKNFKKAKELPSGLKIFYIKKGEGKKPGIGSDILIHYAVYFTDGSLLDTNYKQVAKEYGVYNLEQDKRKGYEPFSSKYSMEASLIQGFKEGLHQMRFGDKTMLFVPHHLAYGTQGKKGIAPNTDLIFELEMYPKNKK